MTTPPTFSQQLTERILRLDTRLCLGLDPRPSLYPGTSVGQPHTPKTLALVEQHCLEVLEVCAPLVACVKPQVAFFEALGQADYSGLALLGRVCAQARQLGLPVLLDAKRGDIPSTAEAYAESWLAGPNSGQALTVNPYLGFDSLLPFIEVAEREGGSVFVLVKTSNPGSSDLQDLETKAGTISEVIAKWLASHSKNYSKNQYGTLGAVVGAPHAAAFAHYRALMPHVWLLLPGLGAQGAKASDLAAAFDQNRLGAIASASRSIHYASNGPDYAIAAYNSAKMLRNELNQSLS
jgi:orotidine-5'-phosphate decarboxylase